MRWKILLKSTLGLNEALSGPLPGEIGINYRHLKIKCSDQDSKLLPLENKSRNSSYTSLLGTGKLH